VSGQGGRQWRWNFNDADYERWKWGSVGDGARPFFEGKRGRRRGGSTMPEAFREERRGGQGG
jgi:hypothetical protein